ncbi:hypothetical protein GCM10012287_01570 [Streptomyces daqingensis]|uniref:Uncharacterized protein n=1 Tax=Streptomyces daqingensis TaxID=1472640 RepID=A0ABQ2LQP6_9ACTN|nr:hypothetical protein GCM10012287_01570 [Streptomyces daqingensis]
MDETLTQPPREAAAATHAAGSPGAGSWETPGRRGPPIDPETPWQHPTPGARFPNLGETARRDPGRRPDVRLLDIEAILEEHGLRHPAPTLHVRKTGRLYHVCRTSIGSLGNSTVTWAC